LGTRRAERKGALFEVIRAHADPGTSGHQTRCCRLALLV